MLYFKEIPPSAQVNPLYASLSGGPTTTFSIGIAFWWRRETSRRMTRSRSARPCWKISFRWAGTKPLATVFESAKARGFDTNQIATSPAARSDVYYSLFPKWDNENKRDVESLDCWTCCFNTGEVWGFLSLIIREKWVISKKLIPPTPPGFWLECIWEVKLCVLCTTPWTLIKVYSFIPSLNISLHKWE